MIIVLYSNGSIHYRHRLSLPLGETSHTHWDIGDGGVIGVASDEVEGDAGSGAVERVDCNEAHFSVEAGGMEPHNYM